MTPASNIKLITTGVALLLLGGDFQFATSVYAAGNIDAQGVLHGDIVVMAGGDPSISGREHDGRITAVFDGWAAEIAKSVRSVRGNLVIDDTVFDRQYVHPSWPKDQLTRPYCAPVSGFALNNNCVNVSVRPGARAGESAQVALDPPTRYFRVENRCRTVASGGTAAYIARLPAGDTLVISGRLSVKSPGVSSPVPVADPARYAGTVLRERLAKGGVRIAGQIIPAAKRSDTRRMARLVTTSHSLVGAVRTANKHSDNFYAETILKTLGRSIATPSSFADGVRAAAGVLDRMGIRRGSYRMADGSGLSRRNAFSAVQLACFLRYMARSRSADAFIGSLPASGVDGTLRRRMARAPYRGSVLAKTGHLRGVSALSGYVRRGSTLLAFSILVNGERLSLSAADRLQDSICRLLVDSAR